MLKHSPGPGLVSLFHSVSAKPLQLWDKKIEGKIKRVADTEVKNLVLEITGNRPFNTYISCPADPKRNLGIRFPFLVLTVKATSTRFFAFDVQILDDKDIRRRFRASTFQSYVEIKPFTCRIPLTLENGWNQVTLPLQKYTKDVYNTNYVATLKVQIYANCRLRRVYLADKEYSEEELPTDLRLFQMMPKNPSKFIARLPKRLDIKFAPSYPEDAVADSDDQQSNVIISKASCHRVPKEDPVFSVTPINLTLPGV